MLADPKEQAAPAQYPFDWHPEWQRDRGVEMCVFDEDIFGPKKQGSLR